MKKFIDLIKTTLNAELKMSFGMFYGFILLAIVLTFFAGIIGILMV